MATLRLADDLVLSLRLDDKVNEHGQGAGQPPGIDSGHALAWSVFSNDPDVPDGQSNLCYRAAQLFFVQTDIDPASVVFEVTIDKRIPAAAGLGGGSSDAAAVLRFLWDCWHKGLAEAAGKNQSTLSFNDLQSIALACGADVPFCLLGGIRVCGGIGEKMTRSLQAPPIPVLLALANTSVRTVDAFKWFDDSCEKGATQCECEQVSAVTEDVWEAMLFDFDPSRFDRYAKNDFLPIMEGHRPEVLSTIKALRATGAFAVSMTGSGPSCFALFRSENELDRAYKSMSARLSDARLIKTALSPKPEFFSH